MDAITLYIKNLLLPSVDSIMSTFTKTIDALEVKAETSSDLASSYRAQARTAQEEADRSAQLALKLKSAFTI